MKTAPGVPPGAAAGKYALALTRQPLRRSGQPQAARPGSTARLVSPSAMWSYVQGRSPPERVQLYLPAHYGPVGRQADPPGQLGRFDARATADPAPQLTPQLPRAARASRGRLIPGRPDAAPNRLPPARRDIAPVPVRENVRLHTATTRRPSTSLRTASCGRTVQKPWITAPTCG